MKQIIQEAYAQLRTNKTFSKLPEQIEFEEMFLRKIFDKKAFFSFYHATHPEDKDHRWFMDGKKLQSPTGRFLVAFLTRLLVSGFEDDPVEHFCQVLDIVPEILPRLEDDLDLREDKIANACIIYRISPVFVFDTHLSPNDKMLMPNE